MRHILQEWRDHTSLWYQSICYFKDVNVGLCKKVLGKLFTNNPEFVFAEGPIDAGIIKIDDNRDTDSIDRQIRAYCCNPPILLFFLEDETRLALYRKIIARTGLTDSFLTKLFKDPLPFRFANPLLLVLQYKLYDKYIPTRNVGIHAAVTMMRFFDFFIKKGIIKNTLLRQSCEFVLNSGIFIMLCNSPYSPRRHICILRAPEFINLNGEYELHCESGPAIKWSDGYALYFLNGVAMSKEIVETRAEDLDPTIIIHKKNPLVRRELIRKIGIERVIEGIGAKTIDKWRRYELLELNFPDLSEMPLYLKMKNPSTGKVHIEGVHPDVQTCREALAWRDQEMKYVVPQQIT